MGYSWRLSGGGGKRGGGVGGGGGGETWNYKFFNNYQHQTEIHDSLKLKIEYMASKSDEMIMVFPPPDY